MKKILKTILILFVFTSTFSLANEVADESKVVLDMVEIFGTKINEEDQKDIYAWYGIPYAKPPTGELRWKAPRDFEFTSNNFDATKLPNRCVQVSNFYDELITGQKEGTVFGSEDCLYLNVFAPADNFKSNNKLPVMFWIHGGGNTWGYSASPMHIPTNFLKFHDVILVTINYRLGPFGWFSVPGLNADAQEPLDLSPNFGTLDMIKSLEWVNENISAFGGDPNNITIFGESAGARNVLSLYLAEPAKKLFKRGIAQSGYFVSDDIEYSRNNSVSGSLTFIKSSIKKKEPAMNPMTLKETLEDSDTLSNYLRDLSKEEIISFYRVRENEGGLIDVPNVIPDEIIIPNEGIFKSYINGKFHDKEIILGTNRDELKLFMSGDPRFIKPVLPSFIANLHPTLGLWTKQRDEKFYDAYSKYKSDAWKLDAVDNAARYISKVNKDNVYAYRFDWDDEPQFLGMDFSKLLGAAHALEIGFIFNSPEIIDRQKSDLSDILYKSENAIFDKELSISMSQYWVNFAYDGNPNSNPYSLDVNWSSWRNGDNEKFIVFDTENDQGIRMNSAILSEDSILQSLSSENLSMKQKCIIFDDLFDGTTLSKEKVSILYEEFLSGKCN